MHQNNRSQHAVARALANTALAPEFAELFDETRSFTDFVFQLSRVIVSGHSYFEEAYQDLVGGVVLHLARLRNVHADAAMHTEVQEALYPGIHLMRRFETMEDVQIGFQAFMSVFVSLAKCARPGYTPADREMFALATSIGTAQWLDLSDPGMPGVKRAECAVLERTELAKFVAEVEKNAPATEKARQLQKENDELRRRVSELEAARIAYANEFPLTADGDPDVGNIHANIRKLKAEHRQAGSK